ncbi:MAG TPA: AAA family ATPase [Burkholderiales bacterium]|nr:AAA family ATPase [Burkholderiales bacterium]
MQPIKQWLEELGFARYAEVFAENDVDLEAMRLLAERDLERLGVSLGHRKKLLKAIAELNGVELPAPTDLPIHASRSTQRESISTESERRQLTVLFCDMVGFTEMANRVDPEVLQGIIRNYEDACAVCITRYEGYVFQRLGDGIVAFFGFPLAHEGEAERAIRAGLEIIEALSKLDIPEAGYLAVRIGIASGVVVVASAEKGAVGETMNLAARLQAVASPGSIVVSERVHRLASGAFEYEDLGEQALKGIARPARAYRILGVSQATSRFEAATQEGLTPLVGREQEIGLLLERWALAQDGEGQVVLLSGEPGIGKSRILSALRERLEGRGAQALRFQCSPYYANSAFWPSIDNFERALKFARDETSESKLDKLEALIVTHYGRPLSDVRFVASMLSIPCEERYGAISMTPQKHKDETLRTLVDITQAAARKQPSVMLFEDAHWADPTTLEVLDLVIDRVRNIPLLIVLTHRPEFQSRWAQHGHVTGLNLSKLTRAQSAAIVSRLASGKALPSVLLEQILTKTDGVPLYVEELTKSILESGELKDAGDRYEYTGTAHTITIPATLRDSLMARLDRFMPVKEIAQIGSAIGREFSHELIEAVAPRAKSELDSALEQLTDSGLAFRRGTPPDAVYTFKHALVQDAAYDSLLKSRRQELHSKIARVIEERFPATKDTEPEVLAHHLTASGLVEDAIPFWQTAGELALKRMALTEAISHLNQGLELVSTLPRSSERNASELGLRTVLGTAWLALKGWPAPDVWTSLHPALALAKSLERNDALLPILWGLMFNVLSQGRIAESLPWAEEMLDIAKATGDSDLLITGHTLVCACYFWMGELIKALEHGDKVLALYDRERHGHLVDILNHDPKTLVGVFATLPTWMLGHPDRAVRRSDEKDAHARLRAHPFDLGWALSIGAEAFDFRCEPEALRRRVEEMDRLGRENNMPVLWALLAPIGYGVALIREGKPAEGIAALKAGLTVWDAGGGKARSPYLKAVLAEGMALTGDLDDALQLIDEQIAQVERPGWEERLHYAEILRLKGWMLSLKGDFEGADNNYLASLNWARHQQAKSWELRTSTSLARLRQSQGKRKEAYDLLAPIYNWFTEGFDTKDLKEAKALLEELS